MLVPMSIVRYNWGTWGKRKVRGGRTGNRGMVKATKLRNKKGFQSHLATFE